MNILQIGCNNCKDHVFDFVSKHIDNINHLIPVDIYDVFIKYANNAYKNVKKLTTIVTAITNDPNQNDMILYHVNNSMFSAHTSFNYDHMIKHKHSPENIVKKTHPSRTVSSILEEYNIKNLDRLYIDTEGLDIDILYSIDYSKYDVRYIWIHEQAVEF